MTAVGNVGGIKDPGFLNFISQPQSYNVSNAQQTGYASTDTSMQQPAQDTFEKPKKKKHTFRKILLWTGLAAAAVLGGTRLAHSQKWLTGATEGSKKFVDTAIKGPLKKLDDWMLSVPNTVKGWFSKKN